MSITFVFYFFENIVQWRSHESLRETLIKAHNLHIINYLHIISIMLNKKNYVSTSRFFLIRNIRKDLGGTPGHLFFCSV